MAYSYTTVVHVVYLALCPTLAAFRHLWPILDLRCSRDYTFCLSLLSPYRTTMDHYSSQHTKKRGTDTCFSRQNGCYCASSRRMIGKHYSLISLIRCICVTIPGTNAQKRMCASLCNVS